MKNPKINLKDLESDKPQIKYCCVKNLIKISKENPEALYTDFDLFVRLLNDQNNIMKWTGIIVIGGLSKVDKQGKVDKILPRLFKLLNSGKMITANNTIGALTEIALAKPKYQKKIADEILKVENYKYDTSECRCIACGRVILALEQFPNNIKKQKKVIEFVKRQTRSRRPATAKKADKLLKKLNKI
jgi:hypothetical protein